jgi:hypothetical protein
LWLHGKKQKIRFRTGLTAVWKLGAPIRFEQNGVFHAKETSTQVCDEILYGSIRLGCTSKRCLSRLRHIAVPYLAGDAHGRMTKITAGVHANDVAFGLSSIACNCFTFVTPFSMIAKSRQLIVAVLCENNVTKLT